MTPEKPRTPRQETYLRLARRVWWETLDGRESWEDPLIRREIYRLLRLAKASVNDL